MKSHIEVGRRYPEITINTPTPSASTTRSSSSAFEGDDPGEFLDLVKELRADRVERVHRARDADLHLRGDVGRKALDALDGTAGGASRPHRSACGSSAAFPILPRSHEQDRNRQRHPLSRRDRRRRPVRLLRRRAHPQGRGPARPGRPLRPPAHPVRPGPRRRRPRPPEDQVGDPRLREDRGARGLPLLRQRQGRPRHRGRGPRAPTTTRSSSRSAARPTASSASPARTCPAATPPPPSSAGTTPTPTTPTTSFDLSTERAVVIGNGNVAMDVARMLALPDDELRQTDTADHAIEPLADAKHQGDRRPRPPRARPGRLHQPRDQGARRDGGRRRASSTPPTSSSTRSPRPTSSPTTPTRPTSVNVESLREFSQRDARGQAQAGSSCASSPRRSRSRATARSSRS